MLSRCQTLFKNFSIDLKKQIGIWYEIKCRKLLSQVMRRSSYIFKENHVFIEEEDNPSNSPKVVIVEEELDGIDIDGIGNAVDLQTLLHFSFFFFFFLSGFSFTDTNDSQDSRGKEGTISYSTRSRTLRHLFATLHVRWLSHFFNRNACIYQTATRWDFNTLSNYHFIDWWCEVSYQVWSEKQQKSGHWSLKFCNFFNFFGHQNSSKLAFHLFFNWKPGFLALFVDMLIFQRLFKGMYLTSMSIYCASISRSR